MLAFEAFWHLDIRNFHSITEALLTLLPRNEDAETLRGLPAYFTDSRDGQTILQDCCQPVGCASQLLDSSWLEHLESASRPLCEFWRIDDQQLEI
jgi:hypothetical protein